MIAVHAGSAVPPYEQIRSQLADQIHDGTLPQGARLPSVRKLADDLQLAPNTIARAYRELEHAGLVHARRRAGTIVASRIAERRTALDTAAHAYVDVARGAGVTSGEALDAIHRALEVMTSTSVSPVPRH